MKVTIKELKHADGSSNFDIIIDQYNNPNHPLKGRVVLHTDAIELHQATIMANDLDNALTDAGAENVTIHHVEESY